MKGYFPPCASAGSSYFCFMINEHSGDLELHYEDNITYPKLYIDEQGNLNYFEPDNSIFSLKDHLRLDDQGKLIYDGSFDIQSVNGDIYINVPYNTYMSQLFTIDDENGTLRYHYKGDKVPNYSINNEGKLIYTIGG